MATVGAALRLGIAPKLVGAIVGFGAIAERAHLPALVQCGLSIVAIVEPNEARQQAARGALPHARIYSDVHAMLACERLDFVDICTPPHLHFEAAQAALSHGIDIICEKPLVLSRDHGEALGALVRKHGRTLTCMHNWTQAPIIVRAAEPLASGVIGAARRLEIVTMRTQPAAAAGAETDWRTCPERAGGGILYDHGWHAMSIMLKLLGHTATEVTASCEQRRYVHLGVEDTADVRVCFAGDIEARFFGTWAASRRENRIVLEGEEGRLEIVNDTLTLFKDGQRLSQQIFAESLADGGYRAGWTAAQIQLFLDEASGEIEREAGLQEALSTQKIIAAAYDSAQLGGASQPVALFC